MFSLVVVRDRINYRSTKNEMVPWLDIHYRLCGHYVVIPKSTESIPKNFTINRLGVGVAVIVII